MSKTLKSAALTAAIVAGLAACVGGAQTSSQPTWKNYGFDGAGAQ